MIPQSGSLIIKRSMLSRLVTLTGQYTTFLAQMTQRRCSTPPCDRIVLSEIYECVYS